MVNNNANPAEGLSNGSSTTDTTPYLMGTVSKSPTIKPGWFGPDAVWAKYW